MAKVVRSAQKKGLKAPLTLSARYRARVQSLSYLPCPALRRES